MAYSFLRIAGIRCLLQILLLASIATPLLILSACEPKVQERGFVLDEESVGQKVKIGASKSDVIRALGSPSTVSHFGGENWYYISSRKEAVAFLKPEVTKQDVVKIEFDSSGRVREIHYFDESDSENFNYAEGKTPTEGHSLGFFEQILGNLGRFNSQKDKDAAQ